MRTMKKSSKQLTPQDIDTHKVADVLRGFMLLMYNHNADFWSAFEQSSHCPEHMYVKLEGIKSRLNKRSCSPDVIIKWMSEFDDSNMAAFADGMVAYFNGMNPQLLAHLPIKEYSEVQS